MNPQAPSTLVSGHLPQALRDADDLLLSLAGGSHYALYSALRRLAAALAPLDSFYVGFCCEADRTIVFPYNFDGREYDDPNLNSYQPGGVTEWIVRERRSYWSHSDGGAMLHRGRAFGDTTRRSAEGVIAPFLDLEGVRPRVAGLIALLSYTPAVYSEETVWALECLAESLATVLAREREDQRRRLRRAALGGVIGSPRTEVVDTAPARMQSPAHIVGEVSERLKRIRYRSEAVRALLPPTGEDALREGVQALVEECERSQTETLELLLHTSITSPDPRSILTPREREVALLLVEGKTNRQIAEQLFVSEKTAKTHVSSIIRKLSAGGRSGVAQLLKPSGGSSTPSM